MKLRIEFDYYCTVLGKRFSDYWVGDTVADFQLYATSMWGGRWRMKGCTSVHKN